MLDQQTVARVAAQFNMPPSLLFGLSQVRAIDSQAELEQQAQYLSQAFAAAGSWEAALSTVVSGDPTAYQAPTSPVGGTVNAIMGIAASRPTWGLDSVWRPASPSLFGRGAGAFGKSISALADLGGVVTPDHAKSWSATVGQLRQSGQTPQGSFAATRGRSTGPAPFAFEAMPFDHRYLGAMTEDFGDRSGPGGYAEMGNDYGLPHGTAVNAPISGTVRVVRPANPRSGTGLTVYIRRDDGTMAYLGHLSDTQLQDGQRVQAGEQIATSGGDPARDAYPGNSTGPHIEIGIIGADGTLYDPRPVLEAVKEGGAAGGGAVPAAPGQERGASPKPPAMGGDDPGRQAQRTTDPKAVAEFAGKLKAMGVTPEEFERGYPHVALTRRRLLGLNTSLDDYAPHAGQTPDQVLSAVRATPHPRYPEHTVGRLFDMTQMMGLFSYPETPLMSQAAKMLSAGFTHRDVSGFYNDLRPTPAPRAPGEAGIATRNADGAAPSSASSNGTDKQRQGGPS